MKFHSLRSFLAALTTLGAALLLTACGGGGASGTPNEGGNLAILPATATFYAGVPATITIAGGRKPYSLSSSEPGLFPVPALVNENIIQVIPNNPGVVDPGITAGELLRRSVTLSVRDVSGVFVVTALYQIGQNFLTGYGLVLSPISCPAGVTGTTAPAACSGGTTAARMNATFNGSLIGNRQFRYEVLRGNFSLRDPVTGAAGNSILLNSDHTGSVLGFIEVPPNVPTQLGVIRVIDVLTGVYADQVFVIQGAPANVLVAIPSSVSFTGATTAACGTGNADILVFDGKPPYTATSSSPNILILNSPSNTQPGRITVQALDPRTCGSSTVVIVDSTGARVTVAVDTKPGSVAPVPPPALAVAPVAITLACGATGSISVVGGTGSYSVTSSNPNITAAVSGNTVAITRSAPNAVAGGVPGGLSTISVTDGATIITVNVTSPPNC